MPSRASESAPSGSSGRLWLDEVTGGLVDGRFVVHRVSPGLFELSAERDYLSAVRRVNGQLTPCVGRERELAALTALLNECVDDSMARAVLVVAQPGRGKSRLRQELVARLRRLYPGLIVLLAHGEPLCTGVSGALLTECLRQLAGIGSADPSEGAPAKLRSTLRRILTGPELERWLIPLGDLGTQPLVYQGSSRITLHERGVSPEQIEQAFVQLMRALSATGPILVVLEDLHHADPLSVRVIDRVLAELAERPLMVLCLARPEVHARFPKLWAAHRVQELRLEPLLPAACAQLIDLVLGPGAEAAAHILQHCRGNAKFLEELILLAVRAPLTSQLPAVLITLEQERLLRLPAPALQVLRAASVFGLHFWEDGLHALLAAVLSAEQIESGLRVLLDAELIIRQRPSRFPATAEFCFRYALSLAAVTPLLSEADRELGLPIAARYL